MPKTQSPSWRNRIVRHAEVDPAQLLANPKNWRIHPAAQRATLKGAITDVGYTDSVEVQDGTDVVLDGHLRVALALQENQPTIPVTYLDLNDAEADEYLAIKDPIAAMAAADAQKIDDLLRDVSTTDAAVMQLLSDLAEDAGVVDFGATEGLTDPDEVPEPPADPITQPGDLWHLGRHRLLCGDSTKAEDVVRLMAGQRAAVIATDPPYGVSLRLENAHEASNAAKGINATYRHFEPIENDDIDGPRLQALLEKSIGAALEASRDDVAVYVWHAHACQTYVDAALRRLGIHLHSQIVWVKPHFVFGRCDYHWQHEPCFYGWPKGNRPPFYGDRNQSTVWTTDVGGGSIRKDQDHPTEKPVSLWEPPLLNHTKAGDICLDLFGGSGTAVIAAEQHGRTACVMELSPAYCDVIVRRWEAFTGETAVRESMQAAAD